MKINADNQASENDLPFHVGDRVAHVREPEMVGTVKQIDADCYPLEVYGVTTCVVEWDDALPGVLDIQWTNKLNLVSGGIVPQPIFR